MNTNELDALTARLRMHARDCVSAADMDTDTVLSAAQIDDMANAFSQAAEALAAPAASVDDEVHEWVRVNLPKSYANKPLVEILELMNASGIEAEQDLIDSAGAAKGERPTDDELWDQTLKERDHYHDMADQLADQIAAITGTDIGEHSSVNCPWQEAMLAADEYLATKLKRAVFGTPQPAEGDGAVCDHESSHAAPWRCAKCGYRFGDTRPAATAVVPDGWQLVPKQPTPFMVGEGAFALRQVDATVTDAYAAMLASVPPVAAAPAAPKGGVVDCPSCMGRGYQGTGIDEAPTTICAACDGTAALATGEQP